MTDDVLTLTKLVLKQPVDLEFLQKADSWVIASACHWYSLRIDKWDLSSARTEAEATVVDQGVMRPFWGWNRAKHALLEAAILMTRLQILDPAFVRCELERLAPAIDKTAGADEFEAWQLIQKHWDQFEPTQPLETTVEPNGP